MNCAEANNIAKIKFPNKTIFVGTWEQCWKEADIRARYVGFHHAGWANIEKISDDYYVLVGNIKESIIPL